MSMLAFVIVMVPTIGLALLTAIPVVQIALATTQLRARPRGEATSAQADASAVRVAVLVPAHNEESGISNTLRQALQSMPPGGRLLVVADNCSDRTAEVARAAGAQVVERTDLAKRGKGYALDYGVRELAADPPDVLIVLDADCGIEPDTLVHLAQRCAQRQRPIQALYLMRSSGSPSLRMRVAEFAWIVKNQVRPVGLARIGAPCQLMGTGMAFPWALIADVGLANGHLVEDMKLGVDCALRGAGPIFAPDTLVTSWFPSDARAALAQRQRWEHGHLSLLGQMLPGLLKTAIERRDGTALLLGADLAVPPLGLLIALQCLGVVVNACVWGWAGWSTPLMISVVTIAALAGAVLAAWFRFGRSVLRSADLLGVALYVLWKIPLYLRFVFKRQKDWLRTRRDHE